MNGNERRYGAAYVGKSPATAVRWKRPVVKLALAAAIAGCMSPAMAQTANTKTTYSYDALDRVTQVTDPSGLNTTYQYDGLSDPTSTTSPDSGTKSLTFDAAGNVLTGTDANGNTVTYTYDAQDRRLSTSYADSTQNITYIYDEPNNVTGCTTSYPIGHLTHVVENAVTTSFCYNAQGYVIQKSQAVNGHTDVTTYTRSPGGKILSITYPSGNQVNYSYDADGRVSSVTATTSSGTSTLVSNVTYLPFGPVSGYTLGNGQTVTRTYDANYRLTDLTSPAFSLHVARDAMGDITAVGNSAGANPATETYGYDPLYRLTAITEVGGSTLESVTYNPTGDRLSKTGSGLATGAYSYNTNTHQLTATGNAARTVDANGNTTAISQAGSTYGFGYNARNRMTVAQLNQSTIASYVYNVSGERVAKTASGATERYNYGPGSQLLSEYGATNREYVYLGDIPVANLDTQGTATSVAYVTADQLGTPRAIADGSGNTVWSWAYQGNAWGEQSPTSNGYTYNLRFPGQYYDAETGINYNVNRDYDSTTGRYVESDPLGLKGGWSTYAYVGNGPLSYVDPIGLVCPAGLKAAGRCIDASNYDPNTDGNRNVLGTPATDKAFLDNASSLDTSETDENYGSITNEDVFTPISGDGKTTSKGYQGTFSIDPNDTAAICHSHPRGDRYSPTPGYGDNSAVENGYPNYIVRDGVAGVVEINNGQYQYRMLEGRLTPAQRRLAQQQLNAYQHP